MGLQEWKQLEPGDRDRGRVLLELWGAHGCCAVAARDNSRVFVLPVPTGTLWEAPLVREQEQQRCGAGWGRGELSPALLEAKAELLSRCWNAGTSTWCCWLLPCVSGAAAATSFSRSQVDDGSPALLDLGCSCLAGSGITIQLSRGNPSRTWHPLTPQRGQSFSPTLPVPLQNPLVFHSPSLCNKPKTRLVFICFIIKLMRLFSPFYAPLNSVFEILWSALQTRAPRPPAPPPGFALEHPCLLPGYSLLPSLLFPAVAERNECSVCYCHLFSLFFNFYFFSPCSHRYFERFLFSLPLQEAIKFPSPCVVWCALTNYH